VVLALLSTFQPLEPKVVMSVAPVPALIAARAAGL